VRPAEEESDMPAGTALVTGAAGFIGSHLSEALQERGWRVRGVDALLEPDETGRKMENWTQLDTADGFEAVQADIRHTDLGALLEGIDVVFHLAAIPGVRTSWGDQFVEYTRHNIEATARLLETCREKKIRRLVYASSSSVYGEAERTPAKETDPTHPVSPYGVTKLAAEHLVRLYGRAFGLETVSLRFFTVYGPRQRPDMAFYRFIEGLLTGGERTIFGDGKQTRDFTFVKDAVAGCLGALEGGTSGGAYNIGGGSRVSVLEVIEMLERVAERKGNWRFVSPEVGDPKHTGADTTMARTEIGYSPSVSLEEGLRQEVEWMRARLDQRSADGS